MLGRDSLSIGILAGNHEVLVGESPLAYSPVTEYLTLSLDSCVACVCTWGGLMSCHGLKCAESGDPRVALGHTCGDSPFRQ